MPASTILMIRPARFGFNNQTATTNHFQQHTTLPTTQLQQKAEHEFDNMATTLRNHGINVIVVNDTPAPPKPDAIFPNNWFATLPNGSLTLFPMLSPNRRPEKRADIISLIQQHCNSNTLFNWSDYEAEGLYLEGTGSMVIDHAHHIIYACRSPRTHPTLLHRFAQQHGYRAIAFNATDENNQPIYHTNVMLCVGQQFAVICADAIPGEEERITAIELLRTTGHEIITISFSQMNAFAGNMIELQNKDGQHCLVMSHTAYDSLTTPQRTTLNRYAHLLPANIPTIQTIGGGGARCMIAELFTTQPH